MGYHIQKIVLVLLWFLTITHPVHAAIFPKEDVIGEMGIHVVQQEENLYDIARNYDLGAEELMAANPGIDPWVPKEGKILIIPNAHVLPKAYQEGVIVINLAEPRLYYSPTGSSKIFTFPVSIGMEGMDTPEGETQVVRKRKNPTWYPPASIRKEKPHLPEKILPGPNNPLGDYALSLGWEGIVIHGTNRPWSIGSRASHGCLRLYPEDIKRLFEEVKVGTPVKIVNESIKIGKVDRIIYLESHYTLSITDKKHLAERIGQLPGISYRGANPRQVEHVMDLKLGYPVAIIMQ